MIDGPTISENSTITLYAAWVVSAAAVGAAVWLITAVYSLKSAMRDSLEKVRADMQGLGHKMDLHVQRIESMIDGNVKRDAMHRWIATFFAKNPDIKQPEDLP